MDGWMDGWMDANPSRWGGVDYGHRRAPRSQSSAAETHLVPRDPPTLFLLLTSLMLSNSPPLAEAVARAFSSSRSLSCCSRTAAWSNIRSYRGGSKKRGILLHQIIPYVPRL